jgi:hypothetical protein
MKYYYWKPKNYTKREYSIKQETSDNKQSSDNKETSDNKQSSDNKETSDNKEKILEIKDNNKKNEVNDKLNERFLIKQTNPNPFFIDSNYIDDLDIQNKFLR